MQGKVDPKPSVMVRQHVQRISEIVSAKIAVPSPAGIRVGIMTGTVTAVFHIVRTAAHFMPVRAGIGYGRRSRHRKA